MIKYNVQKQGEIKELVVSGDVVTICADISLLVNTIYREIQEDAKAPLKQMLESAFDKETGCVFEEKLEEVVKADTKKDGEELLGNLKELEKLLKGFLDLSDNEGKSDED